MDMPLISVIIPVYQAEAYLEECLDSVLAQEYPSLELILVDDGSPDGSPAICDRYAGRHPNIQVIHQENQGPGPARNAGIAAARGEYLMFADADDRLDGPRAIRSLAEAALENGADIASGGFRLMDEGGTPLEYIGPPYRAAPDPDHVRSPDFQFHCFFLHSSMGFLWGKLYRRSFLDAHEIRVGPQAYMEDKCLNLCCYLCRPAYAFTPESVFLYRQNSQSISGQCRQDILEAVEDICASTAAFAARRGEDAGGLIAFAALRGLFAAAGNAASHGQGLRTCARQVSRCMEQPALRRGVRDLARGRYLRGIPSLPWRIAVWGAAAAASCRCYGLLALATVLAGRPSLKRRTRGSTR